MLSNSSASRNRRKGPRRFLKLAIVIDGTDALSEKFTEQTSTRVVTKDGGLFTTARRLRIGSTIRVSTSSIPHAARASRVESPGADGPVVSDAAVREKRGAGACCGSGANTGALGAGRNCGTGCA